jgi:hypothetical protein
MIRAVPWPTVAIVLLLSAGALPVSLAGAGLPGAPTDAPTPSGEVPTAPLAHSAMSIVDQYLAGWSTVTRLAADPANLSDLLMLRASLRFNTSSDTNGSGAALLMGSNDGGASWSTAALPSPSNWSDPSSPVCGEKFDGSGSIAISTNATAVFVGETVPWGARGGCVAPSSRGALYLTERPAGSTDWIVPVAVAGDAAGLLASDPAVAINPIDGAVLVAFEEQLSGTPLLELFNSSAGDSQVVTVAVGNAASIQLVAPAEAGGGLEVAWESSGEVLAAGSSDGGRTFSAPTVVASGLVPAPTVPASLAGDGLAVGSVPNSSKVYAVWVNSSSSLSTADLVVSSISAVPAGSWSPPAAVGSSASMAYFQPSLATLSHGEIAVEWLSQDLATGAYQPMGGLLGGTATDPTLSSGPFALSSSPSSVAFPWNGTNLSTSYVGNSTALAPTPDGFLAAWTDLRSLAAQACGGCASDPARNASVFVNRFVPVTLGANIPSASATLSGALAGNGVVNLSSEGLRFSAAGELGDPFELVAPATASVNGTPWYFAAWVGSEFTASTTFQGNWSGPTNLTACYEPTEGAICTLPGSLGLLEVETSPSDTTGTLDGTPLPFVNGSASEFVSVGPHSLRLQAPGYVPVVDVIAVSPGEIKVLNLPLSPNGRIEGTAFPITASLRIGAVAVSIGANGVFGLNVTPGTYNVSLSAPNYSPFDDPGVVVVLGQTTALELSLSGLADLYGTVSPATATLSAGPLSVNRSGADYSIAVPTGEAVELNVSARGYAPATFGPYVLISGQSERENVVLQVASGWIDGIVSPNGSTVWINGTPAQGANMQAGAFNVSAAAGWYYVNVTAPGFEPSSAVVVVRAGTATWENISLGEPPPSLVGPTLSLGTLGKGLLIDAVLLGGLSAIFVLARRGRFSPSAGGTVR